MSRANRIVSAFVLICFLFNTAVSDLAFGLSAPSRIDDIMGIEPKDEFRVRWALQQELSKFEEEGRKHGLALSAETFESMSKNPRVVENTKFMPADIRISLRDYTMTPHGFCVKVKIKDRYGPRTYYALFSLNKDDKGKFPINVFSEREKSAIFATTLPEKLPSYTKAVERYARHEEGEDAVIRYAHEHGLAREPLKDRLDYSSWVTYSFRRLSIKVANPKNLTPIENREFRLIKVTRELKRLMLSLPKAIVVGADGEEHEVAYIAHSSNNAVYVFVGENDFDILTNPDRKPTPEELGFARDTTCVWLIHELGVMLGLIPHRFIRHGIGEGDQDPVNEIDERFFGFVKDSNIKFPELKLDIANLDTNLATRDFAAGSAHGVVRKLKPGGKMVIDNNIEMTYIGMFYDRELRLNRARFGFMAPKEVTIYRREIYENPEKKDQLDAARARKNASGNVVLSRLSGESFVITIGNKKVATISAFYEQGASNAQVVIDAPVNIPVRPGSLDMDPGTPKPTLAQAARADERHAEAIQVLIDIISQLEGAPVPEFVAEETDRALEEIKGLEKLLGQGQYEQALKKLSSIRDILQNKFDMIRITSKTCNYLQTEQMNGIIRMISESIERFERAIQDPGKFPAPQELGGEPGNSDDVRIGHRTPRTHGNGHVDEGSIRMWADANDLENLLAAGVDQDDMVRKVLAAPKYTTLRGQYEIAIVLDEGDDYQLFSIIANAMNAIVLQNSVEPLKDVYIAIATLTRSKPDLELIAIQACAYVIQGARESGIMMNDLGFTGMTRQFTEGMASFMTQPLPLLSQEDNVQMTRILRAAGVQIEEQSRDSEFHGGPASGELPIDVLQRDAPNMPVGELVAHATQCLPRHAPEIINAIRKGLTGLPKLDEFNVALTKAQAAADEGFEKLLTVWGDRERGRSKVARPAAETQANTQSLVDVVTAEEGEILTLKNGYTVVVGEIMEYLAWNELTWLDINHSSGWLGEVTNIASGKNIGTGQVVKSEDVAVEILEINVSKDKKHGEKGSVKLRVTYTPSPATSASPAPPAAAKKPQLSERVPGEIYLAYRETKQGIGIDSTPPAELIDAMRKSNVIYERALWAYRQIVALSNQTYFANREGSAGIAQDLLGIYADIEALLNRLMDETQPNYLDYIENGAPLQHLAENLQNKYYVELGVLIERLNEEQARLMGESKVPVELSDALIQKAPVSRVIECLNHLRDIVNVIDVPSLEGPDIASGTRVAASQTQAAAVAGEAEQDPVTVLVVDDNPAALHLHSQTIKGIGYNVITAEDGKEALDLIEQGRKPDLVVSDIKMPRMDGYQLADSLPGIPVILISASTPDQAKMAPNVRGFMSRGSFGLAELRQKVLDVLSENPDTQAATAETAKAEPRKPGRRPEPGKSPKNALTVIALSPRLQGQKLNAFTAQDYLDAYTEFVRDHPEYGFKAPAEKAKSRLMTVQRDLNLADNSLVKQGLLIIINKEARNGNQSYIYQVTEKGLKAIEILRQRSKEGIINGARETTLPDESVQAVTRRKVKATPADIMEMIARFSALRDELGFTRQDLIALSEGEAANELGIEKLSETLVKSRLRLLAPKFLTRHDEGSRAYVYRLTEEDGRKTIPALQAYLDGRNVSFMLGRDLLGLHRLQSRSESLNKRVEKTARAAYRILSLAHSESSLPLTSRQRVKEGDVFIRNVNGGKVVYICTDVRGKDGEAIYGIRISKNGFITINSFPDLDELRGEKILFFKSAHTDKLKKLVADIEEEKQAIAVDAEAPSELEAIMPPALAEWLDDWLDLDLFARAVVEAGNVKGREILQDEKSALIFSERAAFGELKADGTYEEGLAFLLPSFIKSNVKVAVVARTKKQQDFIDDYNAGKPKEKHIIRGGSPAEAAALTQAVRRYYVRDESEPEETGIMNIAIVVHKILEAIGTITGITDRKLIEQMHDAGLRVARAA